MDPLYEGLLRASPSLLGVDRIQSQAGTYTDLPRSSFAINICYFRHIERLRTSVTPCPLRSTFRTRRNRHVCWCSTTVRSRLMSFLSTDSHACLSAHDAHGCEVRGDHLFNVESDDRARRKIRLEGSRSCVYDSERCCHCPATHLKVLPRREALPALRAVLAGRCFR